MLTEKKIAKLTAKAKRYSVSDSHGLSIRVNINGTKSWEYRKVTDDGKEVRKTIGSWPEMSLERARFERDKTALNYTEKQKQLQRLASRLTFEAVAENWLEKRCRVLTTPKNVEKQESRLKRLIYPVFGDKYITDVTPADALVVIRAAENQKAFSLAHDLKQLIGMVFRHALANNLCENDITLSLKGALIPHKEQHRASIQNREELSEFLQRIWGMPQCLGKYLLMFHAYTFVRPGEARTAQWSEINIENAEWRIPAEKMKMRRAHVVPLSSQVISVLNELHEFTGDESSYLFPSRVKKGTCLTNVAELAAIRKLGYKTDRMTAHGFRSIASTILNENSWPSDAIERQLSHAETDNVRAAYNYAQFMNIRVPMMQWYADFLDALRQGQSLPQKTHY